MSVLLLGSSGPLNLKVVYCLARLGFPVHVVATSPSNIVRKSRHVASFVVRETVSDKTAPAETLAWLRAHCVEKGVSIIIPGDIGTAGFLAAAGGSLGEISIYPCSDADLLNRIHDKWNFASTLMKAGIATPRTVLVKSAEDTRQVADEIGFPVMVKPLSGESSHGVVRIDDRESLVEHVESGRAYTVPPLIAQRFIQGRDIDISVLADHGRVVLGVTQQLESDGSLRFFRDIPTRRLAEAIIAEYDYHGIAHFDMRVDDRNGEVVALECNPRFWYSMPASMWQGVNFLDAGIRLAKGQVVDHEQKLIPGNYFLPGALLAALRRPWRIKGFTRRNLNGVLQPALDPGPHVTDLYRKFRG